MERATTDLAGYLQTDAVPLADAAYTLQVGRELFNHRRFVVGNSAESVATALDMGDPKRVYSYKQTVRDRQILFMLPGVGDHYSTMSADLYRCEPTFRRWIDRCSELLQPTLGSDLREILYPANASETPKPATNSLRSMVQGADSCTHMGALQQTKLAQPAVFAVEYALAQLLIEWGLQPAALVGYSLGEYTAACLSGVMSLQDALHVVVERANLMTRLKLAA